MCFEDEGYLDSVGLVSDENQLIIDAIRAAAKVGHPVECAIVLSIDKDNNPYTLKILEAMIPFLEAGASTDRNDSILYERSRRDFERLGFLFAECAIGNLRDPKVITYLKQEIDQI